MNLVLTQAAETDLEAIADWIGADNPRRALSFVQELLAACEAIIFAPHAYPIAPRFVDQGIRRKVHGDYLIFYRLDPDAVTVLHILNGARDYDSLLR